MPTSGLPAMTPEMIKRIAELITLDEAALEERKQSLMHYRLIHQAQHLEKIAETDDLSLYRHAKEADIAFAPIIRYFQNQNPALAASTKTPDASKSMLGFLRTDDAARREQLLITAQLLRGLAEQPMDAARMAVAEDCLKMLPEAVRC